ncbi:MAG TPA: serine--tRNA ligase [Candidatus Angelobacter sp.]|jgi:seryl-tRNA synthetase|nr:serine--tRNA ligase [Candidatus Angelobacter sp.]
MLLTSFIREYKKKVLIGLNKRFFPKTDLLNEVLILDESKKKLQIKLEHILSKSKNFSKFLGKKDKINSTEFKKEIKSLRDQLVDISEKLSKKLLQIPNIPDECVKTGKSKEENELIYQEGDFPTLSKSSLPHWNLEKKFRIFDFETGTKISQKGFPIYLGQGARFQRGLIQYFLDKNTESGYFEYELPYLVNEISVQSTGQLPDKEFQMYHLGKDNLYLIPTGEVPLMNIFRNKILEKKQLPIKATTYTPCFRREAGSYGNPVRGLNRIHQFHKVEIIQITEPKKSNFAFEEMKEHIIRLLRSLELPFRVLKLCGGNLGFTASITYDFEVYSAAQHRWLEVSSLSNCTDYQSNRLHLRYRTDEGKKTLCHSLNGSALAIPRVLAALMENNQKKEYITLPKVLVPYTGFEVIKK